MIKNTNIKLLASYAFVAAVISTSLVGFARADGVDEKSPAAIDAHQRDKPDVNYWRDYDKYPCRYDVGLPNTPCINGNRVTTQDYRHLNPVKPVQNVPEPAPVLLMGVALLVFVRRRLNGDSR